MPLLHVITFHCSKTRPVGHCSLHLTASALDMPLLLQMSIEFVMTLQRSSAPMPCWPQRAVFDCFVLLSSFDKTTCLLYITLSTKHFTGHSTPLLLQVSIKFVSSLDNFAAEQRFYAGLASEGSPSSLAGFVPHLHDAIVGCSSSTWSGEHHPPALVLERGHFSLQVRRCLLMRPVLQHAGAAISPAGLLNPSHAYSQS